MHPKVSLLLSTILDISPIASYAINKYSSWMLSQHEYAECMVAQLVKLYNYSESLRERNYPISPFIWYHHLRWKKKKKKSGLYTCFVTARTFECCTSHKNTGNSCDKYFFILVFAHEDAVMHGRSGQLSITQNFMRELSRLYLSNFQVHKLSRSDWRERVELYVHDGWLSEGYDLIRRFFTFFSWNCPALDFTDFTSTERLQKKEREHSQIGQTLECTFKEYCKKFQH